MADRSCSGETPKHRHGKQLRSPQRGNVSGRLPTALTAGQLGTSAQVDGYTGEAAQQLKADA